MPRRLTLLLLLGLGACAGGPPRPALGEEFPLAFSASATVRRTDLRITFTALVTDSRCPSDVQCVWAGEAGVALDAILADGAPQSFRLMMPASATTPDTVAYAGYVIRLVKIDPYPVSTRQAEPMDYVATLVVTQPTPSAPR